MFVNNQLTPLNLAFPDVCDTPLPVEPVPLPYPNLAMPTVGLPAAYTILVDGAPAHNLLTTVPFSQGDDAGVELGVASGMVMGPSRHLLGAFTVLLDGMPATRLLVDLTGQNGLSPNMVGATLIPSQITLLCLAP